MESRRVRKLNFAVSPTDQEHRLLHRTRRIRCLLCTSWCLLTVNSEFQPDKYLLRDLYINRVRRKVKYVLILLASEWVAITLDRRNISKIMSVLSFFPRAMPGNHPPLRLWFLETRDFGGWNGFWVEWNHFTGPQLPLVEAFEPLYLEKKKKKKLNLCVRRGGCDNTDGRPSILPLELVPPRLIPACVVEGRLFPSAPWITCSTVSPASQAHCWERGREKAGMTACSGDLPCLWLHPRNAMHNIMNLCDFFLLRFPRPDGTRSLRNRLEIALGRHLNFRLPSCDSPLLRWRVEFVMSLGKWDLWVRRAGASPSCLCPLPSVAS